jgi:cell fate (sporulation/competence/biofilm development) regulator YlbF (YheA/YmcA/DUF963 family)
MMTLKPLSSDIAQATEALGQNLAYSAPFLQYRAAEQALVADDQAYGLLRAFIRFQGELRQRQIQGTFTAADLEHLGRLQADVQANGVITALYQAQQKVTAYVQEINTEISNLLGVDFAGLARVAGCC